MRKPIKFLAVMLLLAVIATVFAPIGSPLAEAAPSAAKYVFLFIGDGMGYAQIDLAALYHKKLSDINAVGREPLSFQGFTKMGQMHNETLHRLITDSAAAATAMASGKKTTPGIINMDEKGRIKYEIITEFAKKAGYRVGIVTSSALNDATPAAFYSKSKGRSNYYDIGLQLVRSEFDFYGGGGLLYPTDTTGSKRSLFQIAETNEFTLVQTRRDIEQLGFNEGKVIAISPTLNASQAIPYEIDRVNGHADSLTLADFVRAGINSLGDEAGFLMVVEGGNIDKAAHQQDAATVALEVLDFDRAVHAALDFQQQHPDETLIIVTADHETGGLSLGYAGTAYQMYIERLVRQNLSYERYNEYVDQYRQQGAPIDVLTQAAQDAFGIQASAPYAQKDRSMVLSEAEYEGFKAAYELSMVEPGRRGTLSEIDRLQYGESDPLTITCLRIANARAGVVWSSFAHTAQPVPVYASGKQSDLFTGTFDNTEMFSKLMEAMGLVDDR